MVDDHGAERASGGDGAADRDPGGRGRLGVLGWPVAHSRSPAMHNAAFAALGMSDWRYQLLPVPPELFDETTRALGAAGFRGANVTIPHKEAVLALADEVSTTAQAVGAANTLTFAPDGGISAENTDAPGLIAAMAQVVEPGAGVEGSPGPEPTPKAALHGRTALVLGAGGSARAAVWALREAGAEVSVWNRTAARASALADEFGVRAVAHPGAADVLVNCTSVGLQRSAKETTEPLQELGLLHDQVNEYSHVVDLVYRDTTTPLLAAARAAGARTVDGLEILVAQGALSFELWTERRAPREVMLRAARGEQP
jgi:shikimate dehydrogenase